MNNFKDSGLKPEILNALGELGFTEPTPIQAQILPLLDNLPKSLVALAQTGTGKTAGFGLPMVHHIDTSDRSTQALVLCPTRELCLQITEDFKTYAKHIPALQVTPVYGGAPIHIQKKQLGRGAQIVVGTPGRVLDMLGKKYLDLSKVQLVVLDEADEMLNMGFKEDMESILEFTPKEKATWLFSATLPKKMEGIVKRYMSDPMRISIGKQNKGADNVEHHYFTVSARDKFEALHRLLSQHPEIYGVVFCRTREETNTVAAKLNGMGFPAEALNGSLSQQQRDKVMGRFREKLLKILVATDVAARGIDVDDLTHVVNYGLPDDSEVYVHRSGRTGRAGKSGISYSIIQTREKYKISEIQHMIGKQLKPASVPSLSDLAEENVLRICDEIGEADLKGVSVSHIMTQAYLKFENMTREDLIEQIVKYAYNKSVDGRGADRDINAKASPKKERQEKGGKRQKSDYKDPEGKFTRMDVNLGSKHRMNPARLMGIINEVMNNSGVNFGKIEINTHSSAIDVDTRHAMEVANNLEGVQFGSRKIKVELSAQALGRNSRPPKPTGKGKFKGKKQSKGKGRGRRR